MNEFLVQYDGAKRAIAQAREALDQVTDLEGAKNIEARAETLEALAIALAKQANDPELIEQAIDLRKRAQIKTGEFLLTTGKYRASISEEKRKRIIEMRAEGIPHTKVADEVGVSPRSIHNVCNEPFLNKSSMHAPRLAEIGVTPLQSFSWKRLARMPKEQQEEEIQAAKDKAVGRAVKNKMKNINPMPQRKDPIGEAKRAAIGIEVIDNGKTWDEVRSDYGVSATVIRSSIAKEEGRREPRVDREELSLSAQQKLDAAINKEKRRLQAELEQEKARLRASFDEAVQSEIKKSMEEMVLPAFKDRMNDYRLVIKSRKGIMSRAQYRLIASALHPDQSASKERMQEAFVTFTKFQLVLCAEPEIPAPPFPKVPRTYEEMMQAKADSNDSQEIHPRRQDAGPMR